ncbi:MAG: hypothetical protein V4490_00835 [Pseudomonadota bacterium]
MTETSKCYVAVATVVVLFFFTSAYAIDVPYNTVVTTTVDLGSSASLTVEGVISTFGEVAVDSFEYELATITNSGTIVSNASEMALNIGFSDYISVVNTGTISAQSGTAIYEILSVGNSINNSGLIQGAVQAISAYDSVSALITNSGLITAESQTIAFENAYQVTIVNDGTISSSGASAIYGYFSEETSIINRGTISATTNTVLLLQSCTVDNYGVIQATTPGGVAIDIPGMSNTVTLHDGSIIIGSLASGTYPNALNIQLGVDTSYAFDLSGNWVVTDLDGRPTAPGFAIVPTTGAQENANKRLFQRVTSVNDSLSGRFNMSATSVHTTVGLPISTVNKKFSERYWVTPYISRTERDIDTNTLQESRYVANELGVTLGKSLNLALPSIPTEIDGVINLASIRTNIADHSQDVYTSSVLIGAIAPDLKQYFGGTVGAKLLVGYNANRGHRYTLVSTGTGIADVTADYHSLVALAGIEERWLRQVNAQLSGRLLIGLDLTAERYTAYNEGGFYDWSARTMTQASARAEATVTHHKPGTKASLWGSFGVLEHMLLSGHTVTYEVAETALTFVSGTDNDCFVRAQAGLDYQLTKTAKIYGSVNWMKSSRNIQQSGAYFGFVIKN